jgi:hypothetical protein
LLDERFHDNNLSNWTRLDDPDTIEGPSDWHVKPDGWLYQESNIWGRRGDFLGRWYGSFFVAGSPSWTDYRFSVRAQANDDDGFGLIFRFIDAEHFYRLLFVQDGLNGGPLTRLDKREGAEYTELWTTKQGYRPGQILFIEVELTGDSISARVDGSKLFEIHDHSYRHGRVGLFCYAQSGQAFDDVTVAAQ